MSLSSSNGKDRREVTLFSYFLASMVNVGDLIIVRFVLFFKKSSPDQEYHSPRQLVEDREVPTPKSHRKSLSPAFTCQSMSNILLIPRTTLQLRRRSQPAPLRLTTTCGIRILSSRRSVLCSLSLPICTSCLLNKINWLEYA